MTTLINGEATVLPLLARFGAVVLLDSTTLPCLRPLGRWWPGCGGGNAHQTSAALKIHVRYDLLHAVDRPGASRMAAPTTALRRCRPAHSGRYLPGGLDRAGHQHAARPALGARGAGPAARAGK